MKKNSLDESKVIQIFVPELPHTPGWIALSREKQDALLLHTSRIQQNRQLRMLGEFGELMELHQVQELLEGEEMKMVDYLRRLYPDKNIRTIFRKQQVFSELASSIRPDVMKKIAALGADVLSRFERIATAALGDIRNAVRELPALPASTEQGAEKLLEALDSKLSEHRSLRRMGKKLPTDEKYAARMATNAILHYVRLTKLKTSAEKRQFLTRVMGWVMEAQAVSGTLRAGRIPIPDGILVRRGRPPKNRRKEAA